MRALRVLVALAAGLAVVAFAVLAFLRVRYPFELEWQEGGMLAHAGRVRDGLPLYVEPSLAFAPFPYPPLFVWLAALVGDGFTAVRAVSIGATAAVLALLFLGARRSHGALAGGLSAGLFAAGFRFTGAWFDVGRVDLLSLALGLGALEIARRRPGAARAALAALLSFLAVLAKQSALGLALVLVVPLALRRGRDGALYAAVLASTTIGSAVLADLRTDGWFTFTVIRVLEGSPWHTPAILGFWIELARALLPAAMLAAVLRRVWDPFLALAIPALIATAWIGRAHEGGYDNTLLPALLAAALVFGPAASAALRSTRPILAVIVLLQFVLLAYDPRDQLPTGADRAAGEALVERLRAIDGEVFLPHHGYLLERAGKPGVAHAMAITDLLKSGEDEVAARFVAALERELRARRYAAVVLDEPWDDLGALGNHYRLAERWDDADFVPVTGAPRRPRLLYLPIR